MARPASTGRRFQALLIDHALALVVTAAVAAAATPFVTDPTAPAGAAVYGGLLYPPLFLGYKAAAEATRGTTVGKSVRGLAVVGPNGAAPMPGAALARNLLLPVDWLPACYLLGLVVASDDPENRRFGDRMAGTVVVETR